MNADSLKKLRNWFSRNAAELPWRPADLNAERDPYAVWISETMLQQTQVATVKEHFIRWMNRFPNISTLAAADEAEVFRYWQGLGYYSRARNILKTARLLAASETRDRSAKSDGTAPQMPRTRKELEALPGIGAYTAGAILSLAYHQREAILDGNLVRIFARFYAIDVLPTESKSAAALYWDYAKLAADSPKAYMHNEALMELGRTVCKVKNPICESCPLQNQCKAFATGNVNQFPPSKKHVQREWHGTVLVVESGDHKILAVQGGQKFFSNQLALPHFETARSQATGLPQQAEELINADEILSVERIGEFRHSITVHKISCEVLLVKMNKPASKMRPRRSSSSALTQDHHTFEKMEWIEKTKAAETFANSFSLKALELTSSR